MMKAATIGAPESESTLTMVPTWQKFHPQILASPQSVDRVKPDRRESNGRGKNRSDHGPVLSGSYYNLNALSLDAQLKYRKLAYAVH